MDLSTYYKMGIFQEKSKNVLQGTVIMNSSIVTETNHNNASSLLNFTKITLDNASSQKGISESYTSLQPLQSCIPTDALYNPNAGTLNVLVPVYLNLSYVPSRPVENKACLMS